MGFGGGAGAGAGAGEWFRSALRNGTFGTEPRDVAGIGTRGGGGSDDGRRGVDEADAGEAMTLPGASTDSNAIPRPLSPWRLYFVTEGGACTLNKPPTLLVLLAGAGGKPALPRSHASRLSLVTPSTIAMSDN